MRDRELKELSLPSHRASAQAGAAVVEDAHRHLEALAFLAEDVRRRHAHVVEEDGGRVRGANPHLVLVRAVRDAAEVAGDDEGGDLSLLLRRIQSRLREHGVEVRDAAVGDPELLPVEDVEVAVTARAGLDRERVRPAPRLGQAERSDVLARCELRKVAPLLRVVAEQQEAFETDAGMCAEGHGDRRVPGSNLLHHSRVTGVGEPEAAVLFRHDQPEQAHLLQRLEQLRRELTVAIQLAPVDPGHVPVDGLADRRNQLGLVSRHLRVGEELVLEDVAEEQRLAEGSAGVEGHPRSLTHPADSSRNSPRSDRLDRFRHDGFRLVDDALQVRLVAEAFRVDLVDVLGT